MRFEPIAIVGQSCTLPGALSPEALWSNVLAGKSSIGPVSPTRWGLPRASVMGTVERSADRTWSDAGGYVEGFAFDATGTAVPADELRALDPLFQLTVHGVREALRSAGLTGREAATGLVLGNLSFPSAAMARYAQSVWLGQTPRPHPKNRFNSGLPAHLAARALGLTGGAFALDAACASSLYAIKLACDRLQDRSAEVMVAGAVNQADDLFIHVGFCALSALSKTGRSRPFHREADGLVPAEGAGFVVLERLADALAAGHRVLGVIRGVGLSNDGRGRGLLAPSEEGQERALRLAYAQAGLTPADVSLVECHATGTPVGDATELRSMAKVFAGARGVPIGSLKSNLGHLITAAGVAGLIKVLKALEHGTKPPTLHVEQPNPALEGTAFRLLREPESWTGARRAAVSAFGFGGNNAHLVVEAVEETGAQARAFRSPTAGQAARGAGAGAAGSVGVGNVGVGSVGVGSVGVGSVGAGSVGAGSVGVGSVGVGSVGVGSVAAGNVAVGNVAIGVGAVAPVAVAIVGVGARVGRGESAWDFTRELLTGKASREPRQTISVALEGLRFPPNDLQQSLGQQTLVLEAAREAAQGLKLPRDRTSVLVGMGCDAEVARYGARWRLATEGADPLALAQARDGIVAVLQSPGVVGTMPNIPANRINGQLDLAGPAFTVSSEEASGITALQLAARALRAGEIDAALVGAVDLSHEPVHQAALEQLGLATAPGDAAVVLALKRLDDARRDGDPIFATVTLEGTPEPAPSTAERLGANGLELTQRFGKSHASHGLLHVAAAAVALRHAARPRAEGPATPWLGERIAEVSVSVLEAAPARVQLRGGDVAPFLAEAPARLHTYSGANQAEVLAALAAGQPSNAGPARLVIVAASAEELTARAALARRWLEGGGPAPEGVAFRAAPIAGEVAFVFTGAAAAYPGMGRELSLALPQQVAAVAARCAELRDATEWLYGAGDGSPTHPLEQLWGTAFVCQLHAEVTRRVLGLTPQATLGYSSGESNALFAMGAWNDLGEMVKACRASTAFTEDLVGRFAAPRAAWKRLGVEGTGWANHVVSAPLEQVRAALAKEPLAHLAIINTAEDCVIGGEASACARVVEALGKERTLPLGYALVAHCPEVEELREAWWQLHHREVRPVPGVRFYSNGLEASYIPTSASAADAITAQAVRTLDFPRTVARAWADGVRVFIEHGPRGLCSGWIRRTLGEREHLVVPLDVAGRSGVRQLLNAAAQLTAAGVTLDVGALEGLLAAGAPAPHRAKGALTLAAHLPAPKVPARAPSGVAPAAAVSAKPPSAQVASARSPDGVGPAAAESLKLAPASLGAAAQAMAPAPVLEPVLAPHLESPGALAATSSGSNAARSPSSGSARVEALAASQPSPKLPPVEPAPPRAAPGRVELNAAEAAAKLGGAGGAPAELASAAIPSPSMAVRELTGAPRPTSLPTVFGALSRDGRSAPLATDRAPGPASLPTVFGALSRDGRSAPPATDRAPGPASLSTAFGALSRDGRSAPPSTGRAPRPASLPTVSGALSRDAIAAPPSTASAAQVSPMNDPLALFVAQQAQLAAIHREFLAQQAAVHERFLALQQSAEAGLQQAYATVVQGAPALAAGAPPAGNGWTEPSAGAQPVEPASQFAARLEAAQTRPFTSPPPFTQPVAASPAAAAWPSVAPSSAVAQPPSAPPIAARSSAAAQPHSAPPVAASAAVAQSPSAPPVSGSFTIASQAPGTPGTRASAARPTAGPVVRPGPKYDRAQLEVLAGGRISSVFGPQFEGQDGYARQVRMPEPPLLLADRVTGIDAVAGSMGKGTLWTETDVKADSWYLDGEGRMPPGVMIESGQADLLLISWLGIDALNKGERVYRLLGCDLTYSGGLPVPGDTLAYEIHVDGHATQGEVRLFFFHYDCEVRGQRRLSVRNGQAGFFTDEELANSAGVLWDAAEEKPAEARVDAPAIPLTKSRLSNAELKAFAAGRPFECFGPGWESAQAHVRSPHITTERMQFLHEVTAFDPKGGPWGRGYLRAETPVTPKDWFFEGHFKNDPCMPGTLMFDGCLQAMSVYLAGLGFTAERDGWRFEPVPDLKYAMRCRGQVTPASKHLVYEVFVSEVHAGPVPTVYADLLCTVDGRKAFHAKRVGLQLVPDWPLEHWKALAPAASQTSGAPVPLRALAGLKDYVEPKPVATVEGFAFDYHSLLSCAWGPPSAAFGPFYARFDGTRRAARLPGPPYHFMSRITHLEGALGGMKPGTKVEVEYDVPVEQWYFEQNGNPTMPFCVVMEAALQPCGWLASYVGSALTSDTDMLFRNLDGTGTLFVEVLPTSGVFKTKVTLLSISQSAGMIIENFDVECFIGDTKVYAMKTVFGFFPKEAFENQVGLPVTPEEKARLLAPAEATVDLTSRPEKYCGGALRLPGEMLLMLDRVTRYEPTGGAKGLGSLRAEKTVDTDEWFFKAHFFQDPVQPGSLGVEALCQLLQFFMLEKGMGEGLANPRFEPLMLERPVTWKYRGQVVPKNKVITSELNITEVGEDARGRYAVAEGFLWVDGKRIYGTKNLGMRIVSGGGAPPPKGGREPRALTLINPHTAVIASPERPAAQSAAPRTSPAASGVSASTVDRSRVGTSSVGASSVGASSVGASSIGASSVGAANVGAGSASTGARSAATVGSTVHASAPGEETLDPRVDTWLGDHRPTWTLPALPMMSMVDRLAGAVGAGVSSLSDVQVHRWLPFTGEPVRLRTDVAGDGAERTVTLSAWREASNPALSRFEPVASGKVRVGAPPAAPAPFAPLPGLVLEADPYASGALFHGPAFQYLTALKMAPGGSSALLQAEKGTVPHGALNQGLLDAATHGLPHDGLSRWSERIPDDVVGYPYRLKHVNLYAPLPSEGVLRVESRFAGFDGEARFPVLDVQVLSGQRVLVDFRLVEVLLPRGPLGAAPREARRRFLRDGQAVPEVALSRFDGTTTGLSAQVLRQSDWLPGNMAALYRVPASERADVVAQVAQKEHVARRAFVHPSTVTVERGGARAAVRPLRLHPLQVTRLGDDVLVADAAPPTQDLSAVRAYWSEHFNLSGWPVEDLYYGLVERFVGDVVLTDPEGLARLQGRGCLYVANHQVGLESLLFSLLISALSRSVTVTLAKAEHRESWLGTLIAHNFTYPGVEDPGVISFFDREDKSSLVGILGELGQQMREQHKSVFIHVEGTRSLACRQPVVKLSSSLIDMALAVGAPIVPVRLVGGLPVEPLSERLEFPVGYGRQDYWVGRPLLPQELAALPLKERRDVVVAAINALGPDLRTEVPFPGDPHFAAAVEGWRQRTGASLPDSVFFATLAGLRSPGPEVKHLLEGARAGKLVLTGEPRAQWLGQLARRLFGPRGPTIEGLASA